MRLFSPKSAIVVGAFMLSVFFLPALCRANTDSVKGALKMPDQTNSLCLHGQKTNTKTQLRPSIPWGDLGKRVSRQYGNKGVSITAVEHGVQLETVLQRLAGEVGNNGLRLWSTADEDVPQTSFSVLATSLERQNTGATSFDAVGHVEIEEDLVRFVRSGIVEEYSVSADGVRQDFVITEPLPGQGDLRVELSIAGATAHQSGRSVILSPLGSRRRLSYHRLRVLDAQNRELPAELVVETRQSMAVMVDDLGAVYPIRIDPTFSDVNWVGMGFRPEPPGTNGDVYALAVDTNGNLYVGGSFTTAGGAPANRVAKWDGTNWSALGAGVNDTVHALWVNGSDIYAGGWFTEAGGVPANHVAKWDGTKWNALSAGITGTPSGGGGPLVNALVMDESGNLYAGGWFTQAGDVSTPNIAKWDGSGWTAMGDGLSNANGQGVDALIVDGSDLYAGGWFTQTSDDLQLNHIARWDGETWSALGTGTNSFVKALAVYDGILYAGGNFTTAGGVAANHVAKWDGTKWNAVGNGMNGDVDALAVSDYGTLFAGGSFTEADGQPANYLATWDGYGWYAPYNGNPDSSVTTLLWNSSSYGLYAGGFFQTAGTTLANHVALMGEGGWENLREGGDQGIDIYAVAVDGVGNVFVGGRFALAGGVSASNIAKWDGANWSALGPGINGDVYALAIDGSTLYAGGSFRQAGGESAPNIAKWDGANWSALGTGIDSTVYALAVDGNGTLFAGGYFTSAGGVSVSNIAAWNGTTWSALGTGLNASAMVLALAVHGNHLYVGGSFTTAGGVSASKIAVWDGVNWSALGTGIDSSVNALAVDGNGTLFAGGWFNTAGGVAVNNIAAWNGTAWSALGDGLNSEVQALTVDSNNNLYAGGNFDLANWQLAKRVAVWNDTTWSALGDGMNNDVLALAMYGNRLYAGGLFTLAGGQQADGVAYADLTQDTGALTVTIAPQAAIDAGAQWRRTGTDTWYDSDYTENNIPVGDYTVEFCEIGGWTKPVDQSVTVNSGTPAEATGTYTGTPIQPIGPGTYYVSVATGNDANDGSAASPWKTLHHAVSLISGGESGDYVLYVAPGTYSVSNTNSIGDTGEADESLLLSQDNVTIVGDGDTPPVIDGAGAQNWNVGLEMTGSNLQLVNMSVTGFSDDDEKGVYVMEGISCQIRSCSIHGNNWGIRVNFSSDTLISDCDIYDNSTHGIDITWGDWALVQSNKIHDNPMYGVRAESSPTISRNLIYDNKYGILVEAPTESSACPCPIIKNNVIYQATTGSVSYGIAVIVGEYVEVANPEIYHNTIDGGTLSGIKMENSGNQRAPPYPSSNTTSSPTLSSTALKTSVPFRPLTTMTYGTLMPLPIIKAVPPGPMI